MVDVKLSFCRTRLRWREERVETFSHFHQKPIYTTFLTLAFTRPLQLTFCSFILRFIVERLLVPFWGLFSTNIIPDDQLTKTKKRKIICTTIWNHKNLHYNLENMQQTSHKKLYNSIKNLQTHNNILKTQ